MSIIGGLLGSTSGTVTFEGGEERPPRGTLGIVPQKNVLFPELTCYQTLRVWSAIKRTIDAHEDEDLVQLLRDCDLEKKTHANANTLSGGQKRKLQLAIGLVGGSKSILRIFFLYQAAKNSPSLGSCPGRRSMRSNRISIVTLTHRCASVRLELILFHVEQYGEYLVRSVGRER